MEYEKIPFDEKELDSCDEYKLPFPGLPGVKKPNYPISVIENLKRTVAGCPAWVGSDIEFAMFNPLLIPENKARGMVMEVERIPREEFGGPDFFGVEWEFVPQVNGSMVRPGKPLLSEACEWKEKVKFPDISKWDWEGSAKKNDVIINGGKPILITLFTGFFERLISFMDMEGALIAMIDEDEQEDVKELFDKLSDFYIELIKYMKKYYKLKMLWFHDDWGSQRAPMFSYDTVKEVILPYLKKVVDACHEMDILFELHSCGKIDELVPLMVEAGVDLWDGQDMNDKVTLSKKYQGKIMIGVEGVTKPGMTEDELRQVAVNILDTYAPGILLGKAFKSDPRLFPILYEESRKRYNS